MKKIVTAMGSNRLTEAIRKTNSFEIVSRDISYKEGVLEILESVPNIDIIIISEILDGEIDFKELIKRILLIKEKIEIIVFVEEKNSEIQNFLFSNGIYKIYQNNEIDLNTFVHNLCANSGELIIQNQSEKEDLVEDYEKEFEEFNATGKVLALTGSYNSGKSTITCALGMEFAKQGKRTLIIDFDTYNSSIHFLLNVRKYKEADGGFSIDNQITQVQKNLYSFCGTDLLFNENNTIDYVNLEDMIRKFKIHYDIILIDTTSYFKYKYLERILNIADGIFFLIVPSTVEIAKSISILEVFLQDFKVDKNKFKIVLNKINNYSIDKMIISQMVRKIKIVTSIAYDEELEKKIINKKSIDLIKINEMIGE